MDLRDYLRILRGRWRLILLVVLLSVGAAAGLTFSATPIYEARAQLFVSTSGAAVNDAGLAFGGQFAQQRVKSYTEIVASPRVTKAVIDELNLTLSPDELADKISADAPVGTVLIDIFVRDDSPEMAQNIANAVARTFAEVASDLEQPEGSPTSPVKVSVVRTASLPTDPVLPRTTVNLLLGVLVGLTVGVGAAVLRESLDTTLKGADEVHKQLGLSTLGLIAFDRDAVKRPLVVQVDPHSHRAEAFRQLRTNLQFADVDNPPRSIVVTSCLPQEGKSTTACNLAITLSQAGLRVVLVEGDLRRPRLGSYLGLEDAAGLTNALVGSARLTDVLQPWGQTGIRVLLSGPTPPNPSELLGSQQMEDLLADLERSADIVVIDAPPLLPVTDAAVLAALASGAVMVLRADKTTREQADRAVQILRSVDARVYGAVLNMIPLKGSRSHRYGYGYGYGYGYAPQQVSDKKQQKSDKKQQKIEKKQKK